MRTIKTAFTHRFGNAAILALVFAMSGSHCLAEEFTPIVGWDQHIFPSFIIATATVRSSEELKKAADRDHVLGEYWGAIGIAVTAPADKTPVKMTISSDTIMEPTTYSTTLPKKGVKYKIFPTIKYKYPALVRSKQTVPLSVTFRVSIAGQEAEEQTAKATLRSINDCPMSYIEDKMAMDVSFCFATYVNEGHPLVEEILQEALREGVVESFSGRPGAKNAEEAEDSSREVLRQAYAIWHVLSKRGVRYSNITTTVGDSESVSCQHVRLIEESLGNTQANCVDGSVLFASLLRKIGIEPFLVFVPQHCYVGFYLDEEEKHPVAIETTFLGHKIESDGDSKLEGIKAVVDENWVKTNSWGAFVAAVREGTEDYKKNQKKFESEKRDDDDYYLIHIETSRRSGILPIPYTPDGKD